MKNLGLYGNVGIKIIKNNYFLYGRMDNHNTTGNNFTYKITLSQNLNKHFLEQHILQVLEIKFI